MELVQAPIGSGPWMRLEPLILRDFLDNSSFYKHPNVQKGNSSEHALILDFKSKMLEFFEFYGINKMDFLEMKRFFEMYIGAWANKDFFWGVASKVFRVKCTSFRKLSELGPVTQSIHGTSKGLLTSVHRHRPPRGIQRGSDHHDPLQQQSQFPEQLRLPKRNEDQRVPQRRSQPRRCPRRNPGHHQRGRNERIIGPQARIGGSTGAAAGAAQASVEESTPKK